PGRVLGPPFGGDVLDGEAAPRETLADEARAGGVLVAWRIDRRNPNEIGRVLHDLIGCAIDLFDDPIRLGHCDYDTAECGAGKNDRKARQGPAFAHVPSVSEGRGFAVDPLAWPSYSYRSASIGSTCDARSAGTKPAPSATSASSTADAASTPGSHPLSSNSSA